MIQEAVSGLPCGPVTMPREESSVTKCDLIFDVGVSGIHNVPIAGASNTPEPLLAPAELAINCSNTPVICLCISGAMPELKGALIKPFGARLCSSL